MIHARADYNRIQDPENKIPAEEPVFLLRGQDQLAPQLLRDWATRLEQLGGDPLMVAIVRGHAEGMVEWQVLHGKKIPDLPEEKFMYRCVLCRHGFMEEATNCPFCGSSENIIKEEEIK